MKKSIVLSLCTFMIALVLCNCVLPHNYIDTNKNSGNNITDINSGVIDTNSDIKIFSNLIIDGVVVEDQNAIVLEEGYSLVSLLKVLNFYGAEIEWQTNTLAKINFIEVIYELDLQNKTFVKEGTTNNYILRAPGSTFFYCEVIEKDIVLDYVTLRSLLKWCGKPCLITMQNEYIYINSK